MNSSNVSFEGWFFSSQAVLKISASYCLSFHPVGGFAMARFVRRVAAKRWVLLLVLAIIISTLVCVLFWGMKGPPSSPSATTRQGPASPSATTRQGPSSPSATTPQGPASPQAPAAEERNGEELLGAFERPSREAVAEAVSQVSILFGIVILGVVVLFTLFALYLRSSNWIPSFKSGKAPVKRSGPVLPPRERKPERIDLDLEDL